MSYSVQDSSVAHKIVCLRNQNFSLLRQTKVAIRVSFDNCYSLMNCYTIFRSTKNICNIARLNTDTMLKISIRKYPMRIKL